MIHMNYGLVSVKKMKILLYLKFKQLQRDIYLHYSLLFPSRINLPDSKNPERTLQGMKPMQDGIVKNAIISGKA